MPPPGPAGGNASSGVDVINLPVGTDSGSNDGKAVDRKGNTGGSKSLLGEYHLQGLGPSSSWADKLEQYDTDLKAPSKQPAIEAQDTNVGTFSETTTWAGVTPSINITPRIDIPLFGDEDFEESRHFGLLTLQGITHTVYGGSHTESLTATNSNSDRGGNTYTYNSMTERYSNKDYGLCIGIEYYYEKDWLWYIKAAAEFYWEDRGKTDTYNFEAGFWF